MWTGDQGRGGNTGSKCQQMEPEVVEVVVRHNIARGVKIKEGLCPEQRSILSNFLFFCEEWNIPDHRMI